MTQNFRGGSMERSELSKIIYENGIVGAGGAGFPTHVKLSNKAEVIILNCCECEPLLRVDRQIAAIYSEEILKAMELVVDTIGAEIGFIALKSSYKNAVSALGTFIEKYPKLQIKIVDEVYPAGDEVILIYDTIGKVVPEGGLPIDVGAIVINTETILNIYNSVFLNKSVTEKYVTITGAVKKPVTLRVPIGISVKKLIEYAADANIENYKIIMGGPMTGRIVEENTPITKTTKAIIVLPEDHPIILKRLSKTSAKLKIAMSVCSQCQMCTDLCPRHSLGHSIKPNKVMNALANGVTSDIEAYTSTMLCCECGLCEMYSCYQGLSPSSLIKELKGKLREMGVKNPHKSRPERADSMREFRKVPMKRLISRLSLTEYDVAAPIEDMSTEVFKVCIALKQHVGADSVPIVEIGNKVSKGQLVAEVKSGYLGANIHASIDGVVSSIDSNGITIEARGGNNG